MDTLKQRIAVVGAGGVGGHVAARLGLAGYPVTLIARGANLEAIRAKGIVLLSGDDRLVADVDATDDYRAIGDSKLVVVSVKYRDVATVLRQIGPHVKQGARVLFIMNGVPWWFDQAIDEARRPVLAGLAISDETLQAAFPMERLLWGVIMASGQVLEPGVVRNPSAGRGNYIDIGYPDGHVDAALEEASIAFSEAGFQATATSGICDAIWRKLLINAGQSMVGVTVRRAALDVVSDPVLRQVVVACMEEIVAVGRTFGLTVDVDPMVVSDPARNPRHRSSFLQDLDAGRPLDLDSSILAVVDIGRRLKVPVPHLETVAAIVAALSKDAVAAAKEHSPSTPG